MIASLRGQVVGHGKDSLVVEVNGVGFRVIVPKRLLSAQEKAGAEVQLYTYLHVRENELSLYGADTEEELEFFRLLIGVNGVGPKVAMSILSELSPAALRDAVVSEDALSLARVPGIGPKTARKIAFHLRDRFSVEDMYPIVASAEQAWQGEVIAALTALGYDLKEARSAIASLPSGEMEFEERLRLALRYFAK